MRRYATALAAQAGIDDEALVLNRRSLDRQPEAGLSNAIRSGGRGSLIVLDLDRLREINDTYGHEAGDRALRVVGNVLGSTVRENDLCGRFAGDERMYRDKAGRRSRSSARHSLARNERA